MPGYEGNFVLMTSYIFVFIDGNKVLAVLFLCA